MQGFFHPKVKIIFGDKKLMSSTLINQIFADHTDNFTSTQKLILLAMARFCREGDNKAYRSLNDLAADTRLTKRCVLKALKELKSMWVLIPIESQHGYQTRSVVYMINQNKINGGERSSPDRERGSPIKEKTPVPDRERGSPHYVYNDYNNIIHKKNNDLIKENSHDLDIQEKFEEWWKAYPRKLDRRKAYSDFCVAMKQTDFETLMRKTKSYARMRDKITENKPEQEMFTKSAHQWLQNWGWEDHYGKYEVEPIVLSKNPCISPYREQSPYKERDCPPTAEEIEKVRLMLAEIGIRNAA